MTLRPTTQPLRVLVVDDEPPARERLQRLLVGNEEVHCVGTAADGLEALQRIKETHPDVVLLDIEMPGLDGLAVATALRDDGPAVIFVTAFRDYAVQAFETSAIDYLLKPVRKERLLAALQRVRDRSTSPKAQVLKLGKHWPERPKTMAVATTSGYIVFEPCHVSLALAQDHYTCLYVNGREILSDESLDHLTARLDESDFLRVHRSATVNISCIRELIREGDRKYVLTLSSPSDIRVSISRERLEVVKTRLGIG